MLRIQWCLWLRKTPGLFPKHPLHMFLLFPETNSTYMWFTEPWGNTSLRPRWGGRPENHTSRSESNFPCHPGRFLYPSYPPAPASQSFWRTERCSSRPHPLPEHVKPAIVSCSSLFLVFCCPPQIPYAHHAHVLGMMYRILLHQHTPHFIAFYSQCYSLRVRCPAVPLLF